jgi:hypothetical protein
VIQAQTHEREVGATNLQYAEVTAVIRRANGKIERVVLDSYESETHRAQREAAGLELPAPTFSDPPKRRSRLLRWLPFLSMLAIGGCVAAIPKCAQAAALPLMVGATVIVNAGQAIITNRMTGAGTEPKFVMWGTGAGTAAVTDTTLFTETTDEARTTGTSSRVTTTVTNDTYQVVGTITVATSGKTITNVGLFDVVTASSGNLYFKSDFTGLLLAVADSITFTIKVKFA